MNRRYELQAVLEGILGSGNVYFRSLIHISEPTRLLSL